MKLFEEAAGRGAISGEDAFTLQATYGFPIELTLELARERGMAVDEDGYDAADGGAPGDLARRRRQGRGRSGPPSSRARPASRPSSSAGRRPRC